MNENIADEIRKTIESIKDMKIQASGINNYLSILEGMMRADIQKKVDEAYQRGLEDGKKAFDLLDAERDSEYQRGLDDAWEAARKIVEMSDSSYWEVFDEYKENLFGKIFAAEATEKLKAYEEKQKADEKIKVGDEVRAEDGTAVFVVTWMSENCICGVDLEGKCYSYEPREVCGKTGIKYSVNISNITRGENNEN